MDLWAPGGPYHDHAVGDDGSLAAKRAKNIRKATNPLQAELSLLAGRCTVPVVVVRGKVLDGDERKLYALSGRRHDGLLMHTSQLTFSFKLLLLSKEVDGKMLQLKVAPVGDAHRQWIEPLLTMPVICMSRKPDSRRPPEPARPPTPPAPPAPRPGPR